MSNQLSWVLAAAVCVGAVCQGCQGSSPVLGSVETEPAGLTQGAVLTATGGPCWTGDEASASFAGYEVGEVVVEDSTSCASGICLVNHLQGRASCPYGQTAEQAAQAPACFVPTTGAPVTVAVKPQLAGRPGSLASTCSCRCADPGPGPFCECPGGMQCAPSLVASNSALGAAAAAEAGSYCVPAGMAYDASVVTPECDKNAGNCGN